MGEEWERDERDERGGKQWDREGRVKLEGEKK